MTNPIAVGLGNHGPFAEICKRCGGIVQFWRHKRPWLDEDGNYHTVRICVLCGEEA